MWKCSPPNDRLFFDHQCLCCGIRVRFCVLRAYVWKIMTELKIIVRFIRLNYCPFLAVKGKAKCANNNLIYNVILLFLISFLSKLGHWHLVLMRFVKIDLTFLHICRAGWVLYLFYHCCARQELKFLLYTFVIPNMSQLSHWQLMLILWNKCWSHFLSVAGEHASSIQFNILLLGTFRQQQTCHVVHIAHYLKSAQLNF